MKQNPNSSKNPNSKSTLSKSSHSEEWTIRETKAREENRNRELRFQDVELFESYSAIEIATLAANCKGATDPDRIEAAIQLLSAAERSAFRGKRERYRQRQLKAGHPGWATPEDFNAEFESVENEKECRWLARNICDEAERDEETGKILRKSLVGLAYQSAGIGKADSAHGLRLYNDWLKSKAIAIAQEIASVEICKIENIPIDPSNFIMWTDAQFRHWEDLLEPSMKPALVELKSLSESKNRTPLIHDEETAYDLMRGFLRFLAEVPKKENLEIIHSQKVATKGQVVSPKTRGAERQLDGTFGSSRGTTNTTMAVRLPNKKGKSSD